jgi:long-chain acyl-CoA synthetase
LSTETVNRTYWGGWTGIMFRDPVMRLVSRASQVLPVDQSSRPLANLALGAAALSRGYNLVWFSEGTRSRDGRLQPFQPGIGLILTAYPVPVIPVRIEGSFEALPPGAWWPRRRQIRILFGEAMNPDTLAGQRAGPDRYRAIAAALHDHVAALGLRPDQLQDRTKTGLST